MSRARQPVSINGIEFDALIDEEAAYEAEVPAYPVEEGFDVSDTIILQPLTLSMTLFVSNTPVTWRSRHGTGRVQDVISQLEELYYSKTPVVIITTDKTYRSMGLVGLTLSKTYDTGFDREIPVSFQEIRVTQAQTTIMPEVIAENAGETAGSGGKGGTTGANAGTANTKISDTPRPAGSTGGPQAVEGTSSGGSTLLHNLTGAAGLWGD